jgi:predicted TIM-barrel fold metal-dependent hydrolase
MASFQKNYDQLMEMLTGMEIIDTHEHLASEAFRLKARPDFSLLFSHYCKGDLLAAGMPPGKVAAFIEEKTPLDEKWRSFEPFYQCIQEGSYCRSAHIAMEKFYGFSRLTSLADAEALTEVIRRERKEGLYRRVIRDACHIRLVVNFEGVQGHPDLFVSVNYGTGYAEVSKGTIRSMEDRLGVSCGNLNAFVEAVRKNLEKQKQEGMKGLKFHQAYSRDLYFAPTTHFEAEKVFNRIMEESYGWRTGLGYEESRPLQDYMVHRVVEMAGELEVPVVFHTGLLAYTDHNADDARPTRLWNLPHRYRHVDFVLLHSGLPWMEDAAMLAKQFANVYLDMAFDHIMSPELSTRALKSWIDLVPRNKIFGFGGDYGVVEKIYGHLTLARQDIARALAEKMDSDGMSLESAKAWIQAIMFDNPNRVYRLGF